MLKIIHLKFILILLFLSSAQICFSQTEYKCNIEKVVVADQQSDNLSKKIILEFLKTFDISCERNVEYMEYSNEVLFLILNQDPAKVIKVLNNNLRKLDFVQIQSHLENPMHDLDNLEELKKRILGIKQKSNTKTMIIESLERAISGKSSTSRKTEKNPTFGLV